MERDVAVLLLLFTLGALGLAVAQDTPRESELQERVDVNLVMIETLVLDSRGRTVPGLTRDDFDLVVQGRQREIDEFDVICPGGQLDDITVAGFDERRDPIAPQQPRRVVFVVDYYHLGTVNRGVGVGSIAGMLAKGKTPAEEIMLVALANGVRVEQRFTSDIDELMAALERMNHDASLFAMDFGSITDRSFFGNLAVLMDVLAEYEGPKAVVLLSNWVATSADWDSWFWDVATRAALSRSVIYPVAVAGLQAGGPVGGSPSMARLANESGGRFTHNTNDLSVGYARAQRDLACRYGIGFYIERAQAQNPRTVRVRVKEQRGLEIRSAEVFKLWSEDERRANRMRAAFADPGKFENPLVRATAVPIRPLSPNRWEVFASVNFPYPVGPDGASFDVATTISRGPTVIDRMNRQLTLEPPAGSSEAKERMITLYGLGDLKPGSYTLDVVLARPGTDDLVTASTGLAVPEVPGEGLFLRGPLLARLDPDGIRLRSGKEQGRREEALDEILGAAGTVEPLVVHQIDAGDRLLTVWEACTVDRSFSGQGATVERAVLDHDGRAVHRWEPVSLALEGKKKARCHGALEPLESGSLPPGKYRLEVRVLDGPGGETIARGRVPLMVR